MSPWIIEQNNWWQGIHTVLTKRESTIANNHFNFYDQLEIS
jgi:hypothetical protein